MAKLGVIAIAKRYFGLCAVAAALAFATSTQAAYERVTTLQDENGWKLQVDGRDFYVKGFVWGYTPRGANYTFNLWSEPEERIRAVLDHDFGLMAAAGVTANRSFTIIPPKWVTYIYEKYGIYSVINPLMGRYGASIDGVWVPFTDYSDQRTREVLKEEVFEVVRTYKDVPGVLMFALGNESNYGLSWSSFEIEDLPVGEQNREKAKFLYSLFGETIREAKEIAPEHLFTIVNGDIQYLDLIAEYASEMDVLGINAYRGISFEDKANNVSMWRDVKEGFDRPIVFMEFGSDAFNARTFAEDEPAQAHYLRGQWQEIYNKSYGNGEEGNAIGGFVFEWRDEWWKYRQTENLDIQDRTASWANGGYKFDHVEGQNNMNEEWFGVARLGDINDDGVYIAEPRMAYDVLKEVWKEDPYGMSRTAINASFGGIDMDTMQLRSDIRKIQAQNQENNKFRLVGGSFTGEMFVQGFDSDIDEDGEDGLTFSDGQMAFFDFAFEPTRDIKGDMTVNLLANVADSNFELRYGDRGETLTVEGIETTTELGAIQISREEVDITDNERIEIYDFQASYTTTGYDLNAFYHVPRYHWRYEGDYFGLLYETTDMEGQDIWNEKAPYGFEYVGKGETDGLKIVAGPEIYWGANPATIIKYQFGHNDKYSVVMFEDIARRDESQSFTEATERQYRAVTLYGRFDPLENVQLEIGGIVANTEREGDDYDRVESGEIKVDQIDYEDTLGIKSTLTFNKGSTTESYIGLNLAGLVADGGEPHREWGTDLPYSSLGNKYEIEGGVRKTWGVHTIYPRFLYRENVVDANPNIEAVTTGPNLSPGIDSRNREEDPFAVLDNREATSLELIYTYDPTPATYFYAWNVDMIEDAPMAFNLGLTATSYGTDTDAELFFFEGTRSNVPFGGGIAEEDVWQLKSKLVLNPRKGLTQVYDVYIGEKQSTGVPDEETLEYYAVEAKLIVDKIHIYEGYVKVDDFGPYDFQEQFNIVYPLQLKLEYARLLDALADEDRSSRYGIKLLYRELDELSAEDEYQDGENDYMFEIQTYFTLRF
ncbi:MAG: hypothetical protein QNJ85_11965 [Gammaproteobacteria bacterium]|nr:hypothetical protein [Gammaproteobacteria bacterium]